MCQVLSNGSATRPLGLSRSSDAVDRLLTLGMIERLAAAPVNMEGTGTLQDGVTRWSRGVGVLGESRPGGWTFLCYVEPAVDASGARPSAQAHIYHGDEIHPASTWLPAAETS